MGGERFPKSSEELTLHASGLKQGILKGVEDGSIFLAHVKRDESTSPFVPRDTISGDGCMCGSLGWGEVVRAGPFGGGFPETKDLVYLRLLEKRNGWVQLEYFENAV